MAIITSAGLSVPATVPPFNKNGSVVTLKKISETDWLLFGDLAEGDSEGFGGGGSTSNGRMKLLYNTALSRDMWVGEDCEVYYEGEKLPRPMSGSNPVSGRMPFPEEGNILIELDFMERPSRYELPYLTIDGGALLEILDWGEFPSWVNKVRFISFSNYLEKVPDTLPRQITVLDDLFTHAPKFNQDISGWDVSNVTSMRNLFYGAKAFNQDLSGWCVSNIPSQPSNFSTNATSWTLPKPIWGTCP